MTLSARRTSAESLDDLTLSFAPVVESYSGQAGPQQSFHGVPQLRVGGRPKRTSYLTFTVSGLGERRVEQAELWLQVRRGTGDPGRVRLLGSADASMPGSGPVHRGAIVKFDLSPFITGDGVYALALDGGPRAVRYFSSTATRGEPPALVLRLAAEAEPAFASAVAAAPTTLQFTAAADA